MSKKRKFNFNWDLLDKYKVPREEVISEPV